MVCRTYKPRDKSRSEAIGRLPDDPATEFGDLIRIQRSVKHSFPLDGARTAGNHVDSWVVLAWDGAMLCFCMGLGELALAL